MALHAPLSYRPFIGAFLSAIIFVGRANKNACVNALSHTFRSKISRMSATNRHSVLSMSASSEVHASQQKIAIIGGGVAGLSCAKHLADAQVFSEVVVFDTGRLRPGGRCSSRSPNDRPADPKQSQATIIGSQVVDHAAQIISVSSDSDSPFSHQVHQWEKEGILKRFPEGCVCEIIPDSNESSPNSYSVRALNRNSNKSIMYYGVNGMGSIPLSMASSGGFAVAQDVWISPSSGVKFMSSGSESTTKGDNMSPSWRVKGKNPNCGDFHQLVIAHNGKCADRLMSKTPAKALHSLLRTNFSPTVPKDGGKRMTLNSIYSLTFAIQKDSPCFPVPEHMMSAFVKNEDSLRFLTCNTRKHAASPSNVEIWTLLSSPKFGKKHKGPQENLPDETVSNVTFLLLSALERSLDLQEGALTREGIVLDTKLQLWGAAVPINTWKAKPIDSNVDASGFLYDDNFSVGVCGDWLLESSIEGAWESGRRLAGWMLHNESQQSASNKSMSVGLPPHGRFQSSAAALKTGIGSVGNAPSQRKQKSRK